VHFYPHLCTPGKTFQSVTYPEIALGQTRLTLEFFAGGLLKKKVYLSGMSILSILLNLKSGCHNSDAGILNCGYSGVVIVQLVGVCTLGGLGKKIVLGVVEA
jgi:hypothetical protein